MQALKQHIGVGRRKTAVARVYLRKGSGKITINGINSEDYFPDEAQRYVVYQPLEVTDLQKNFDIVINASGGGKSGQAGAIRLGIARALVLEDENNYATLRANGFMTRDSRMVERKKYGQPGARRHFQFSKR